MTNNEKKVLARMKKWLIRNHVAYDLWFEYDENGEIINWSGRVGLYDQGVKWSQKQ